MQILIVELESDLRAQELSNILSSMNFVKKVSSINTPKEMLIALQEYESSEKGYSRINPSGIRSEQILCSITIVSCRFNNCRFYYNGCQWRLQQLSVIPGSQ